MYPDRSQKINRKVRELVIRDHENGLSCRKIAEKFEISKGAVHKIYKKFKDTKTVDDLPRSGRPRETSIYEDRRIIRESRKNPFHTSRFIKENLELNISTKTVQRRLREAGLHSHRATCRPLLSEKNKKCRLAFAKKYVDKPLSFWKKIVWSDESKFELKAMKKKPTVWRKSGEKFKKGFIVPTVKFGGGSVMVWGCFSYAGTGNLVPIEGIMDAEKYISIINENLVESALKMSLDDQFILQQDNDPKHTARKTTQFFKDYKFFTNFMNRTLTYFKLFSNFST